MPLPVIRFLNELGPKLLNKIPRNPLFCSFASFLIVSLTLFINKPESSRDVTTFMISYIYSVEIIKIINPESNIFLWITTFVADAASVNPNGIKTLLANGISIFPIKGNPVFKNGTKRLPKNPPDCNILCNWVFDHFILAEELFPKALRSLETCVLVNNNLWEKLFSSPESPIMLDEKY